MNLPIRILGLSYEALDAKVHVRERDVKSTVKTGLSELSVNLVDVDDVPEHMQRVVIEYRHFVIASDEQEKPFYEASAVVKAFLDVERSVYPLDDEPIDFLDHALSLLMPMSGSKVQLLCYEVGVSPPPAVSYRPVRSAVKSDESSAEG